MLRMPMFNRWSLWGRLSETYRSKNEPEYHNDPKENEEIQDIDTNKENTIQELYNKKLLWFN